MQIGEVQHDRPGTLNRVSGLLRARSFNIESLTVGTTDVRFILAERAYKDSAEGVESAGSVQARVVADLREWGWKVSPKTVAASMARQGLVGRPTRRSSPRSCLSSLPKHRHY